MTRQPVGQRRPVGSRLAIVMACAALLCIVATLRAAPPVRCASSSAADGARRIKLGKQAFESACAACHGLDGRGGQHAPGIADNPAVQSLSDPALARVIRNGLRARGMPAFAFLGDRQIATIVGYLRTLGGGAAKSVAGDPARGEALFFGKARCSECHRAAGQGGFIASDLSRFAEAHSPDEIRRVILRPAEVLGARATAVAVETHDGQHFSGLVRNEDNFSVQLLGTDGVFHLLLKPDIVRLTRDTRSLMPSDYGTRLRAEEIVDLTSYLVSLAARPKARPASSQAGRRRIPRSH